MSTPRQRSSENKGGGDMPLPGSTIPRRLRGVVRGLGALLFLAAAGDLSRAQETAAADAGKPPMSSPAAAEAEKPKADPAADAEWEALLKLNPLPEPPAAWRTNPPAEETVKGWMKTEGDRLIALADRAAAFRKNFPADPRAPIMQRLEGQALASAFKLGSDAAKERLPGADEAVLKDATLTEAERFEVRSRQVEQRARVKLQESTTAARELFEAGARELIKEFPKRPEPYAMLLEVVDRGSDAGSRAALREIAEGAAPEAIRVQARGTLNRYEALGKPIDLSFKALDGSQVSTAAMKGKVIAVTFWATWAGSYVQDLIHLKAAYERLRPIGLEVIGVSLDTDRASLEKYVKDNGVPWPQYFAPKLEENEIARRYGIRSVPLIWLIDRNGVLRDLDATRGLGTKLENLLGE